MESLSFSSDKKSAKSIEFFSPLDHSTVTKNGLISSMRDMRGFIYSNGLIFLSFPKSFWVERKDIQGRAEKIRCTSGRNLLSCFHI